LFNEGRALVGNPYIWVFSLIVKGLRLKKLAQQLNMDQKNTENIKGIQIRSEHIHFDTLVEAFKRKDVKAICSSYLGLTQQGFQVSNIKIDKGKLFFYFRDPDGNLFKVTS
jgi:hypothetical protein